MSPLQPGTSVYAMVHTVAKSGMSRTMSFHVAQEGEIVNVTGRIAKAYGAKVIRVGGHDVIRVRGCGMDMAFHVVSTASQNIFGWDFALTHKML